MLQGVLGSVIVQPPPVSPEGNATAVFVEPVPVVSIDDLPDVANDSSDSRARTLGLNLALLHGAMLAPLAAATAAPIAAAAVAVPVAATVAGGAALAATAASTLAAATGAAGAGAGAAAPPRNATAPAVPGGPVNDALNAHLRNINSAIDSVRAAAGNNSAMAGPLSLITSSLGQALNLLATNAGIRDLQTVLDTIGNAVAQGCQLQCPGKCRLLCPTDLSAILSGAAANTNRAQRLVSSLPGALPTTVNIGGKPLSFSVGGNLGPLVGGGLAVDASMDRGLSGAGAANFAGILDLLGVGGGASQPTASVNVGSGSPDAAVNVGGGRRPAPLPTDGSSSSLLGLSMDGALNMGNWLRGGASWDSSLGHGVSVAAAFNGLGGDNSAVAASARPPGTADVGPVPPPGATANPVPAVSANSAPPVMSANVIGGPGSSPGASAGLRFNLGQVVNSGVRIGGTLRDGLVVSSDMRVGAPAVVAGPSSASPASIATADANAVNAANTAAAANAAALRAAAVAANSPSLANTAAANAAIADAGRANTAADNTAANAAALTRLPAAPAVA